MHDEEGPFVAHEIHIPRKFEPLLKQNKRYKVYYGGRGGAKSHNIARALLVKGMNTKGGLRVVCAREIQKSIKDSVHKLLSDLIRKYEMTDIYEILESTIRGRPGTDAAGTEFIFRGLKFNTTDMKSLEGADIIWIEEAENVSNNSWEILIPTMRKEITLDDGTVVPSEIWVSFNPKNATDPTYVRFIKEFNPEYMICEKVSYRDNPFFPKVLDDERKRLEAADPDAYGHIWEGELDIRKSGAVYAKQLAKAREQGRITRVPYDPAYEVFTAWDLGFADATAIWWLQFVGRELRWLKYYENSGETLEHYAKVIKDAEKEYGYNYMKNGHFLPHDGGADNIRGLSVAKQLGDLGVRCQVLSRENDLAPGIELMRQTIAYSAFEAELCKDGLHALDNYAYEWDENLGRFKNNPKHDWASHGSSAGRYAAIAATKVKAGLTLGGQKSFQVPGGGPGWMGA